MSARQKLNSIYITIAAIVASVLGWTSGTIVVFVLCFGILAGVLFYNGSIRAGSARR